ncbi:uncharacterized protein CELE_C04B4.5 [Caenorhabditis elegans]|uniref:Uncharacterized protein n=1 Tax=Caenorhabditis elegans TaxID=6239 RepID=Q17617_CAEEL|nr:Uncharacterized protein CELE_C04B4.5 [Caenorhabditis elegans]CAA93524.1 Uncharacterized protein CELE_C04B4.5 [Caenorhabditis elegans]|eukprot:NP_510050.1 Uncharacterized protein CELE_C04B4.5 [Caenorhabditis elegans]
MSDYEEFNDENVPPDEIETDVGITQMVFYHYRTRQPLQQLLPAEFETNDREFNMGNFLWAMNEPNQGVNNISEESDVESFVDESEEEDEAENDENLQVPIENNWDQEMHQFIRRLLEVNLFKISKKLHIGFVEFWTCRGRGAAEYGAVDRKGSAEYHISYFDSTLFGFSLFQTLFADIVEFGSSFVSLSSFNSEHCTISIFQSCSLKFFSESDFWSRLSNRKKKIITDHEF